MIRTKASTSLILLFFLMVSLVLSVACSKGDGSAWVGAIPLEEALSNGKPTVAEFGAATCIPCKRMKPILEELVAEHGNELNMSFVDVRDHTDLPRQYRITSIPTQVFFDSGGQELTRHVGFWPKEEIMAHLEELGLL
jgi:thioredoxin 1